MALRGIDALIESTVNMFVTSKEWRVSLHQFIKFALIGVVNTFIDFGVYYTLTRHVAFFDVATPRKYIANVISFLIATTFSFYSNRSWTFKRSDKASLNEAFRFYGTTTSGLVINEILLFGLINIFGMYDLVAKILATFVTIFWNFFLKKFWVFTPATAAKAE